MPLLETETCASPTTEIRGQLSTNGRQTTEQSCTRRAPTDKRGTHELRSRPRANQNKMMESSNQQRPCTRALHCFCRSARVPCSAYLARRVDSLSEKHAAVEDRIVPAQPLGPGVVTLIPDGNGWFREGVFGYERAKSNCANRCVFAVWQQ